MNRPSNYSRALRLLRAASGLRQIDMAARLGISAAHLSLIETGKRNPSLDILQKICETFGIHTFQLTLLASPKEALRQPKGSPENAANLLETLLSLEDSVAAKA